MCLISFNVTPYQEINFKSHLSSVLLCKYKSNVRFAYVPCDFISLYLIVFTFAMRLKSANYKNHWNILNNVRFEYVPWKNVWFCSIYIVWVRFSHKIEKFWFWKSLKYFNTFWLKKGVRFEYVPWKDVWFCFISMVLGSL